MHTKYMKITSTVYIDIIYKFISILFISLSISALLFYSIWADYIEIVHKLLELLSIFIGFATFLIMWNKHEKENTINYVLGFGFLIVSVLDMMHTYYYPYLIEGNFSKGDFSIKYWITARIVEVATLMIFAYKPYKKNKSKYSLMIRTTITTIALIYTLEMHRLLPSNALSEGRISIIKLVLHCLVIMIAILSLYKLKNNLQTTEQHIKFKSLYICILLIIPSEICFVFYRSINSIWEVNGHTLKIFSYYYLYKAVFQGLIDYPYDKLNENNQRLSDILNAIPIPLHTYDKDRRVDFVNRKFEELFKYPREKVLNLKDFELQKVLSKVGNEDEDTLANRVLNNDDNTKNIIRTYLDSEGKEIKILINGHKIKGGVLVLTNDVKHEQQIKDLNLQAQTILNAIKVPTMILDYNGVIVACNECLAELVDMEYKDISGMNIHDLNELNNFNNYELIKRYKSDNFKKEVNEAEIMTPKGNRKHIQVSISVISNIYNEKIGVFIVIQDISRIKGEQQKLINQEKLALLGQMGATIVHETRNFLTTIKGNSQLIELFVNDEKIKKYARKINNDTNEVNRIISDFLNLSKPRETELEEVAFNDLISSMKSTIETSSLINKVQVILNLDYDERYILCDETQIRQVILNICKNAVEAMEDTINPMLSIITGLDENNREVYIKISDNGKGIDDETIKKIGTPFFTTKKSGTGLGLNACYQIIKEHKGRIDVESKLGKGTTFTIFIPYIDELEDII